MVEQKRRGRRGYPDHADWRRHQRRRMILVVLACAGGVLAVLWLAMSILGR